MEAAIKKHARDLPKLYRKVFFYFLPGRKNLHLIVLLHKGKIICPGLQKAFSGTSHLLLRLSAKSQLYILQR